jgi:multiple sugar transport system ATP-binding protein
MGELYVHNLTKSVEGQLIIDRIDLHMRHDEFLVLLGPEHSGKTTLLRLISGLIEPDGGEIWLDGTNITNLAPNKREICMAFQSGKSLQPQLTAYENIANSIRNQGMTKQGIEMQVISTAQVLGIGHLLQHRTGSLSSEDLQRVALARVLARSARLSLFDEPLTYTDINRRHAAWQEMLMVHRLKSQLSIFATCEPREALALDQRIAIIGSGRIHQVGTANELLYTPANTFVAQYLSTPPISLVHGYVQDTYRQGGGLRYRILCHGFSLTLPLRWNEVMQRFDSSDILLGIRADTLSLLWSSDSAKSQVNVTRALVVEVETHAKSTTLRLRLHSGEEMWTIFRPMPYQQVLPGQLLTLGLDPERVLLFHPLTRQLLLPGSA